MEGDSGDPLGIVCSILYAGGAWHLVNISTGLVWSRAGQHTPACGWWEWLNGQRPFCVFLHSCVLVVPVLAALREYFCILANRPDSGGRLPIFFSPKLLYFILGVSRLKSPLLQCKSMGKINSPDFFFQNVPLTSLKMLACMLLFVDGTYGRSPQ